MTAKSSKSGSQQAPRKDAAEFALDREYLSAVQSTLSEWASAEDAAAYDGLMRKLRNASPKASAKLREA